MLTSRVKAFIGVSIVISIIIALHYLGVLNGVEQSVRAVMSVPSGFVYKKTHQFASEGEQQHAQDTARAAFDSAKFILLSEENESLRRQLNFISKTPYSSIGGDIIGQDVEPVGNTIIINRGTHDGIENGQPVIAYDGIFVGKIVRTEESTAVIRLLHDGQSKVAATILNNDHSIGIVEGGYGISVRMNFIPQNEHVSPGDVIITSGLEKGIPRGLVIGRVEAVEKEAYQPFQKAILSTAADFEHLVTVSVITGI